MWLKFNIQLLDKAVLTILTAERPRYDVVAPFDWKAEKERRGRERDEGGVSYKWGGCLLLSWLPVCPAHTVSDVLHGDLHHGAVESRSFLLHQSDSGPIKPNTWAPLYWTRLNWVAELDLFSTWRFSRLFKANWTLPTIYKPKHSNSTLSACRACTCTPSVSPVSFICFVSAHWFTQWSSHQGLILTQTANQFIVSAYVYRPISEMYVVCSDETISPVNSHCGIMQKVTEQQFWWLIVYLSGRMSAVNWSQLLKYEDLLIFCQCKSNVIGFLDCCLDKTRKLRRSPWPSGILWWAFSSCLTL